MNVANDDRAFKAELNYSNSTWKFIIRKNFAFMSSPAVQIYMSFHVFHSLIFISYGYITNSQIAHLPLEVLVQLVKYCTSFTEDAG